MILEGFRSLARKSLRRTPVRLRVSAIEKKAIAAVMARRGCKSVCPIERRLKAAATRLRKGRTLADPNAAAGTEDGSRVGRPSRVVGFGGRRWSVGPRTMCDLASARALPLVWARMRSRSAEEGSGRGDFNISIQAAPRRASASIALQLSQPTI